MSHPCDKYPAIEFPWERALLRALNSMKLTGSTPAKKRSKRLQRYSTKRANYREFIDAGLNIIGGRKTLHFPNDRTLPKLTKRRYTAWLPKRSDHVTKHEMQLAKIAALMWQGKTTPQIAKRLNLAPRTARENVRFLLHHAGKEQIRRFPAKSLILVREESYAAD